MPYAANPNDLADFQRELLGESGKPGIWQNNDFGKDATGKPVGGQENPLSYNVMPLPQLGDPNGYILKNFKYYECLNFSDSIAGMGIAPNRGGRVSQNPRALFYEQQVKFAEGPAVNTIAHLENGAWLWLPRFVQNPGPYAPEGDHLVPALDQPSDIAIAKQISVPHGNSILALGAFDTICEVDAAQECTKKRTTIPGSPVIPDAPYPLPSPRIPAQNDNPPPALISNLNAQGRYSHPLTSSPAGPNDYQNPHPNFTLNSNLPIQLAVGIIKPEEYMHWRVTTEQLQGGKGHVTNIPFERRVSEVTDYFADYWLLFKKEGGKTAKYLAYTQTILMRMKLEEQKYDETKNHYIFPHITCNTLTLVS